MLELKIFRAKLKKTFKVGYIVASTILLLAILMLLLQYLLEIISIEGIEVLYIIGAIVSIVMFAFLFVLENNTYSEAGTLKVNKQYFEIYCDDLLKSYSIGDIKRLNIRIMGYADQRIQTVTQTKLLVEDFMVQKAGGNYNFISILTTSKDLHRFYFLLDSKETLVSFKELVTYWKSQTRVWYNQIN